MINSGKKLPARPLAKIIGGIIGIKNSQKRETLETHIKGLSGFNTLDMGCTAEDGSFFVDYETLTMKRKSNPKNSKTTKKYYEDRTFKSLEMSKPEHSLIMFRMQLTSYLQQSIGTVPAIDMKQYLSNIGEKIDKEI